MIRIMIKSVIEVIREEIAISWLIDEYGLEMAINLLLKK